MTVAKKIRAKQLKKMAPYKNDCGEKNLSQPKDKQTHLIKMTAAKKIGVEQKIHLIKMTAAQKIWAKQRRIKKMRLKKMTVAKKIGAKQLKKMAPYENDCAQKNLNQTA